MSGETRQSDMRGPSGAGNPDLDWSQVRETVLMLNLAVAQIEHSMRDGDDSVETLVNSFTGMSGSVQAIAAAAEDLGQDGDVQQIRSTILDKCRAVSASMQSAIIAFQFYDKMTQRLSHVASSLGSLGELVVDSRRLFNPYEWHGLQEQIKSKYTVDEELRMFDAILKGASVQEALDLVNPDAGAGENVELF